MAPETKNEHFKALTKNLMNKQFSYILDGRNTYNDCFEFVFPIIVTDPNDDPRIITDKDELNALYDSLPDSINLRTVFPIKVIQNGNTITLKTKRELDALYHECDMSDGQYCFDFKYPLDVNEVNGMVTINDKDELAVLKTDSKKKQAIEFVFPITIILKNNDEKVIGSATELDTESDNCIKVTGPDNNDPEFCPLGLIYPIIIIQENGTRSTFNTEPEFQVFLNALAKDEYFEFQYPIRVKTRFGMRQTVRNKDKFLNLGYNCDVPCFINSDVFWLSY